MNLITAFKAGQKGSNRGLPMGDGLKAISAAINGIQKGRIYTIGAAPKGGKSTFADVGFTIEPCIYVLDNNTRVKVKLAEVISKLALVTDTAERLFLNKEYETIQSKIIELDLIYLSYEIDRVSKEFDFMTHFLNRDYTITQINLPTGKTHKGLTTVPLSSAYLKGELVYDTTDPDIEAETVKVDPNLLVKIKAIYTDRIIPLFGEYDDQGVQISKGIIIFMENKDNPTGIRNYLLDY
jgi:hypothetical protein